MTSYYRFIAIFHTALIKRAPDKIVLDPVKIEFFRGPRKLIVPAQIDHIVPLEQFATQTIPFVPNVQLSLSIGPFISITVRTKEDVPYKAKKFCEEHLNTTIAYMASVYDYALFAQQIYRGQLLEENEQIMEGMLLVKNPVSIPADLSVSLTDMRSVLIKDQNIHDRYSLMARFFAKSLLVQPSEEKFLYLWTILEIFPMTNTSNIKPISAYLGQFMHKDPELVKERLGIGKLFDIRSRLVHDGLLAIPGKDEGETFNRLQTICIEVFRSMSGLTYSGSLDQYFVSQ